MAKKKASTKPQLKLCAAAWTLRNYPSAEKEWSIDTKIKRVKEAGFDGFSAGAEPAIAEACAKYGLTLIGGVDVGKAVEAEPRMQAFKDLGVMHVNVQLWAALLESDAAENGSRMAAMDAATKNAGELVDNLTLQMNRIRQAAITREIIEVVSGADALA